MAFSFRERKENIKKVQSKKYDLVIIGGGITGAGVARDALSRGMSVALVEARDFAEGTSSRSSKLIHGGVRYLENFEFGLVFEALAERSLLFKMAPHLVHPLRFLIPIYKSSRVGFWKMLAGMWLYDLLALMDTPKMHESLEPSEVEERIPVINKRELTGAMEYSDAYTDDDRLVIETLRDANRLGGHLINYASVESVLVEDEKIKSLKVKDQITGDEFQVQGQHFVSGVGPWTDIFGEKVSNDWKKKLRPTKGVHLVFHKDRIPVSRAVVMAVEKRIIFVIPRHEMVIVGTTDTDFNDNPIEVGTSKEDVLYLLAAVNNYFPGLKVTEDDILSSYSGIRPLVDDGSSSEGKTSREHSIWNYFDNLTFVAGGKYTTYRKISEDVIDHVLDCFPFDDQMSFNSSNTQKELNPLITDTLIERDRIEFFKNNKDEFSLSPQWMEKLFFRHAGESRKILKIIADKYSHYSSEQAYWMGEADFAINETCCLSLRDFYWRRSPLFLSYEDHGMSLLEGLSQVFKEELSLSADEISKQIDQVKQQIQTDLSWKATP